jgi:hypothetical protein
MGLSSRGGPGNSSTARSPSSIHSLHPPRRKPIADPRRDPRVFGQRSRKHLGHDLPRHIVIGRAEPSAADHQPDLIEGETNRSRQLRTVVTQHALVRDLDSEHIQLIGNQQRVGIDARRA